MKWNISRDDIYGGMCGWIAVNETELVFEAVVTSAENGQLVRGHASSIVHKESLRMGFSRPSPVYDFHSDMPFLAWVIMLLPIISKTKTFISKAGLFCTLLSSFLNDIHVYMSSRGRFAAS